MYVPEGNRSSSVRFRSRNCGCIWFLFTRLVSDEESKSIMSSKVFEEMTSPRIVCRFCESWSSTVDLAVVDWAWFTGLPLFLLYDVTWGDLCILGSSNTRKPSVGLKSPFCDGGFNSLRGMKLRGSCKQTQNVIKSHSATCSPQASNTALLDPRSPWSKKHSLLLSGTQIVKRTLRNKDTKQPLHGLVH